jgi:hypothetical protein
MKVNLFQSIENRNSILCTELFPITFIICNKLQQHIQADKIFFSVQRTQNNSFMTNNLSSCSPEYIPKSNPIGQICLEQYQSIKTGTRNMQKWQLICLFIIIITMQGLSKTDFLKSDNQVFTSNKILGVDKGMPGYSAGWRGSGNRSAPPLNRKIRPFSTEVIQQTSDAGYEQFAFYPNAFNAAIQKT